MERRLLISIPVQLAQSQGEPSDETELTYTSNISAHGACVISNHPWRPGDVAEVTTLVDPLALRAKVVHCQRRDETQYLVGLAFRGNRVPWYKLDAPAGARHATGTLLVRQEAGRW